MLRAPGWVWSTGLLVAALLPAQPARALPVFAHRYGFTCQQCHTIVPHLNAFGENFLRHGFRLPNARGVFPIAVKTELDYSSGGGGDQDEPGGGPPLPKFIVNEIELLSAGSLGNNTSFYLEQYVVDGGEPGLPRDMWLNFDQYISADQTGTALHAKLGEFTLPLLYDPETQRPTITGYGVYSQTVGANPFNFFQDGIGSDLSITNDRSGIEAHLVLAESYIPQSGIPDGGINVMGTYSQTFANYLTLQALPVSRTDSAHAGRGSLLASGRTSALSARALRIRRRYSDRVRQQRRRVRPGHPFVGRLSSDIVDVQ